MGIVLAQVASASISLLGELVLRGHQAGPRWASRPGGRSRADMIGDAPRATWISSQARGFSGRPSRGHLRRGPRSGLLDRILRSGEVAEPPEDGAQHCARGRAAGPGRWGAAMTSSEPVFWRPAHHLPHLDGHVEWRPAGTRGGGGLGGDLVARSGLSDVHESSTREKLLRLGNTPSVTGLPSFRRAPAWPDRERPGPRRTPARRSFSFLAKPDLKRDVRLDVCCGQLAIW